jgi:hypothetical protein
VAVGGLTLQGQAEPNLTTTGSFNLTPGGAGTIRLVSAYTFRQTIPTCGGLFTTAAPTSLRLLYVPEVGTVGLLGSAWVCFALSRRLRR